MLKSMNFLSGKSRGRVGGGGGLSPLAPVILCLVHRILFQQGFNLVNKFALLLNKCWFTQDSWDKPKNDGCRRRGVSAYSQSGRSMIEMLGVLAIIAVLSVGGIAGYSKAMEMFKINKAVGEYSMLAAGLLEHVDYFNNLNKDGTQYPLVETVKALNLVPETWGIISVQDMRDSWGNLLGIFTRSGHFQLEINLGKGNSKSSVKFCEAMMRDFAQPLSNTLYQAYFFRWNHPGTSYYGDKYCYESDGECLRNLKLTDINQICKSCVDDESLRYCSLILNF